MTEDKVINVFAEIQNRVSACNGGYPFEISREGHTLRLRIDDSEDRQLIYKYLLLATRMDMKGQRFQADIDGTELLEELSAEVAQNYLGERAESMVFGTSSRARFSAQVKRLCKRVKEGGGFRNEEMSSITKDGKLDVVAWKHSQISALAS